MRLILLFIVLLTIGCGQKTENKSEITLKENQIKELLTEWKRDSLGCLRTRDPEKMKIYANKLIGMDSFELIEQLGQPNFRYGKKEERHFSYVLECAKDRKSYYNFYFHFDRDTIKWFSNPVQ